MVVDIDEVVDKEEEEEEEEIINLNDQEIDIMIEEMVCGFYFIFLFFLLT